MNALNNTIELKTTYDTIESLELYIAKMQKKFSPIGISYTKENIQEIKDLETIDLIKLTITIDIPVLKHNGWTYYGTVKKVLMENCDQENMLYSNKENNTVLHNYKNLEHFNCDHCNTNHQRYTVHVFKHDDNREFVLGTSCAKEYFGINVYNQLANLLNLYPKIIDFQEDLEKDYSFRGGSMIIKSDFCKIAQYVIQKQGRYISNQGNELMINQELSTKEQVSSIYHARYAYNPELAKLKKEILSLDIPDLMPEIKEYWSKKEDNNNFIHNVQTSLKMFAPGEGLLTYAIWEYMREVQDFTGKYKFKNRLNKSVYIGSKGEKINSINVEVYNIASFETQYGTMNIISMIDNNNHVIIWKTSTLKTQKGEKRTIKIATIKEHSEYNTVKQTIVKNVKFA